MSITDELRKWVKSLYTPNSAQVKDEAFRIADRIDAEHKKAIHELYGLAEGSILLPKDADGKTIHLQDRVSWDNGIFNVHELNLTADGWTTWDEMHGYTVRADQCRHVKPDSWEAIIEDAAKNIYPNGAFNPCWDEVRDELVERCKRLAGEDA